MEVIDACVMHLLKEAEQLLVLSSLLQAASLVQWDLGKPNRYYSLQRECATNRKRASVILRELGFPEYMEITAEMDMLSKEPLEQSQLGDHLIEQYRKLECGDSPYGVSQPLKKAA